MRFSEEKKAFVLSEEGLTEDIEKKKEGESDDQRMARVCLPAMNSINPDLQFTVETQDDFERQRLPTLDFELWKEGNLIRHSYFQKKMKTPLVIMERSAMSQQQKVQILSNELLRRLSNVQQGVVTREEIREIIDQLVKEMKNS